MNYQEWLATVPEAIAGDKLWKVTAYLLALFLADIGWEDVTKLVGDRRTLGLSDQLYRSLGSVGANLAEVALCGTSFLSRITYYASEIMEALNEQS
jgi:hypothetical protein